MSNLRGLRILGQGLGVSAFRESKLPWSNFYIKRNSWTPSGIGMVFRYCNGQCDLVSISVAHCSSDSSRLTLEAFHLLNALWLQGPRPDDSGKKEWQSSPILRLSCWFLSCGSLRMLTVDDALFHFCWNMLPFAMLKCPLYVFELI